MSYELYVIRSSKLTLRSKKNSGFKIFSYLYFKKKSLVFSLMTLDFFLSLQTINGVRNGLNRE